MVSDPDIIQGPQVSERVFNNRIECITFVETIADGLPVVDTDGQFNFTSQDGMTFTGGCIQNEREFDALNLNMGFI